jgi:ABC-2 type transport system ATP-binding protein
VSLPHASEAPAVAIQDLVVRYGTFPAVDGLTLTAPRGAITAVLGPNGAGKTTTVETAEGYRTPTSGSVRVLGRHPRRDRAELRQRVGVMLQEGGAYAGARVGEVLGAAAALYAHPLPAGELLARLGLTDQVRQTVKRLSGGQAQRLRLALAVIGRPEVAFLDEPTAGLDPQARHATWDLVRELRAAGGSVVLTTHYLEEAEQLADHVVILDAGRAVAAGSPRELTGSGTATQALRFDAAPGLDLDDLGAALPTGCVATGSPDGHYEVTGPVGPQALAAVAHWCAAHDVAPERLGLTSRTLEDVFLELTGKGLRG